MKLSLVKLVISLSFVQLSFQYGSYPRRYTRDHSSQEACPSQCRCMNLNQRSVRGLFDSWNVGRSWQSSEPDESGRSVVCQGLRELPADIPSDVTKLTVYGDSSNVRSRDPRHLISDTQIQYINRNSFQHSVAIKEVVLSGNNIAIMYPSVFHYLRNLETLSLTNNNIRHMSAAAFNGLANLKELRLSDNMIKFVPYALFTYLAELKSLYLNGNKIKRLPRDVFRSLTHLQVLDLSRNNVSDFYDDVFDHNGELQELLLNGNRLWAVRPRWFKNLYSLRILSLRGNAISSIPEDSFSNLFNLEELLLSANHIEDIEDGAFNNLRDLKSLDLSTNDLSEIRQSHLMELDSVAELFVSNNKLVEIKNGTFEHNRQLKLLDLSRNDISKIETASFRSLRQLQILDLSHNKMQKLPKGFIYGIENLEELRLDNNFIGSIQQGVFLTSSSERLSKMRRLELNNNNLRKLDAYTFKGMPRLRTLTLGNNNIRTINQHAFTVFQYLEDLALNNNKIRDLNNGIFKTLKTVYSIDLSNNKIRTITENSLVGLDKLEDLNLSKNKLNSIHKLALRAVPNLKTLDVKENRLMSFNFTYITNMAQLSVIDLSKNHLFWIDIPQGAYLRLKDLILSGNNLQTLDSNIDNIMGRSSIISLDNNPWSCDCKMQWALDPTKTFRLDSTKDAMCKTPTHLHGKKFSDLDVQEMKCDSKNKSVDDVTVTCTDDVFAKGPIKGRKTIQKEMMNKHVTIYRNRGDYVTDGVLLTDQWALVPAGSLKYLSKDDMIVRIGRAKKSYKISYIIEHPLLSLGMQRFNVALIRLIQKKSLSILENQCIIAEKQLHSLSSVLPVFYITIRMDGKKPKTRLKIRKGKVSKKCANDKDYICGVVKEYKSDKFSSVDGAPLYVGHSSNLRLAGIGTRSWSNQKSIFYFIPLWTVTGWTNDVIKEFDLKCEEESNGNVKCKDLHLPLADEIYQKIQNTERH